jgi:glutaconyl-CoA/methylmalonyl-CoA decarboxylase subunit gamma
MRKYDLTINDKAFSVTVKSFSTEAAELEVNGATYRVRVDQIIADTRRPIPTKRPAGSTSPVRAAGPAAAAPTAAPVAGGAGSLTAPIPGQILAVFVKVGENVTAGQPVLKMEAMKMENVINAHVGGTVSAVQVAPGDAVSQGQELIIIG